MSHSLVQLLLDPERFFQERAEESRGLLFPAAIVLAIAIIGSISAYFMLGLTLLLMPSSSQGMADLIVAIGMVSSIAGAFIGWVVVTAVIYGISALLGGKGAFRGLLENIGWGYFPQLFGSLLSLIFMYDFVSSTSVSPVEDPMLVAEAMTRFMSHPSMLSIQVISVVFMLWSANIWIFGTKSARGLKMKNAVISVLLPIGLYLLYMIYVLIGYLGVF
ncbi:MAG: YIP1 family protein [Methanomicrobiales archaeon]|nr:YIP1 family protein [Methanomicrobiales archaeon]